jgi:CheY-like chemotaxis protein
LAELTRTGDIKRAPVVLVTTEGKEADIQRGLAAGATEYLRKPFKLSDVKAIVDRLAPWNEAGAEAKGADGGKASESGAAGGGR